jgi:glycosyltransferase involved in cell wall biosynthesis
VPKLTVTVITLNEADRIEACLESVAWADELIVVDSGSTDGTPHLARNRRARVIVRDWPGYSAQKNFAAGEAANDWILSLDADERVTPHLAEEIRRTLSVEPAAAGFRLPRVTWHLGRWIRTTDWYPDFQLRLYNRRRARWAERRVHESVTADGAVEHLRHDLEHYAYRDIAHHHRTMERYTMLAAEEMQEAGRTASAFDLVVHPFAAFIRNYILRAGVLDGLAGFTVSIMNSYYVFLKFARLRELGRRRTTK